MICPELRRFGQGRAMLGRRNKYPRPRRATSARATDFVLSCMALDKALGLAQALHGILRSR
jgi:hypothetical protein